jgi:hypothetical protein
VVVVVVEEVEEIFPTLQRQVQRVHVLPEPCFQLLAIPFPATLLEIFQEWQVKRKTIEEEEEDVCF